MTWANQTRILREQLRALAAVIGGTLINALKPLVKALNTAMGHIISFAETISNALGKIFGWTYEKGSGGTGIAQDFEDASGYSEELEDSTGKVADNIEKMQKGIRAFDKLTLITMPDSNAGGGGGRGTGGALSGLSGGGGGSRKQESSTKEFESDIDNLYDLGKHIGDTLQKVLARINWKSVYEKAGNFGKGLAQFLNGLISPDLFYQLGRTIAGSLNAALQFLNEFGKEFDWSDFGLSIAAGVNGFFEEFDGGLFAATINTWAHGLLDTIIEALSNIKWEEIGKDIGDFLAGLDFIGIGKKVAKALWEGIKGAWLLFKGAFDAGPIEGALSAILVSPVIIGFGSKLVGLITKPLSLITKPLSLITKPLSSLGKPLSNLANPLSQVSAGFSNLSSAMGGLSAPALGGVAAIAALVLGLGYVFVTNEEVRESFFQAASSIREGLQPAIQFVTETLLPDLKAGFERLMEILSPLGEFLENVFTSVWQDMINPALTYIGETVLPLVTSTLENLWNNVLVPFGAFLASVLEPAISIISDVLSVLWENVVVPLAEAVGTVLSKAFEGLMDVFNLVCDAINPVIELMQFLWDNVLAPLVNALWETLKPAFETVFETIGGIIDGLGKILGGLIDFIVGTFTGNWKKAWNGVSDIFKGAFNVVASIAEGIINRIIQNINRFLGGFNDIVSAIGDTIGLSISIPTIPEVTIPRFETGGFPKQYSLFMAGENGVPEIAGTVGGKTAVAGGAEITGIRDAIYSTSQEEIQLLRVQNQLLRGILEKESGITTDQIGRAASKYASDYKKRTGKSAYSY